MNNQFIFSLMGHWHGSGGSGTDEYSAYAVKKNKLKSVIYIDYLGKYIVSGDSKLSKGKNKKAAYFFIIQFNTTRENLLWTWDSCLGWDEADRLAEILLGKVLGLIVRVKN